MTMEEVNCLLCGSNDFAVLATNERFGYRVRNVVCRKCGLVYLNPRPTAAELREYYAGNYARDYKTDQRSLDELAQVELRNAHQQLAWAAQVADLRPGRALDVGCSTAAYLSLLKERGWSVLGVEPNAEMAAFAEQKRDVPVLCGTLGDLPVDSGLFDLVHMAHVLEHFSNPSAALRTLAGLVREGGYLQIEVPNVLKPSGWYRDFFHHVHLINFSANTLRHMLAETGWEMVAQDENCPSLRVLARRKTDAPALAAPLPVDDYRHVQRVVRRFRYLDWVWLIRRDIRREGVQSAPRRVAVRLMQVVFGPERGGRWAEKMSRSVFRSHRSF